MEDTGNQQHVVFTAAVVCGAVYGALAAVYVAKGGLPTTTILLAILGLCIVLPVLGWAIRYAFPRVRDYATGVMLSPFPGAVAYLAMTLVIAIA